jgi:predicted PurR-regulated permease PerM
LIVIVAALIAYAIVPVVDFFHRIMPRPLAILLAYLLVVIVLGGVIYFVVTTAVFQITLIVHSITHWLTPDRSGKSPLLQLLLNTGLTQGQIDSFQQQLVGSLSNVAGSLASGLVPMLGGVAGSLLNILLTVVISIYLLVDGDRPIRWILQIIPRSRRGQATTTIEMVRRVVGGYIRGQVLLCAIIGFLAGVGLLVLGFPYAALLGVLTFITEFIPVLGTIFAGTIAIVLALTQGWVMAVEVLVFFILLHLLEGYILAPRLVGRAVQLNPAIMLIALTVGSELFGPFGAIFAAPTAGLLHALFTAFWLQYRKTHSDEFADDQNNPVENPAEKTSAAPSSTAP